MDAGMDVPGLPQSATGQAALMPGVNTARLMGRHVEGFPGPALREAIRGHNLFARLRALGCEATFANAYFVTDAADVAQRRIQSVTTVAALHGLGGVRDTRQLAANEAVYQDLTRESLREKGYEGPITTPAEAARHLVAIARQNHFTLFEYFQTDRMGHRGRREDVLRGLSLFDQFLGGVLSFLDDPSHLLMITSDHGNIEVAATPLHTSNPVPFVAMGAGAEFLKARVRLITDVAPAILALYEGGEGAGGRL